MNLATPPQEIRVHDPAAPRSGLPDFRANVTYLSGYEDFSRHAEVGTPVDLITRIGSSPPVRAIAPSSSYNRAAVIFTAPENTGIYTVTAASMTNPTQSSTATIVVTDVAGVHTAHDDPARDRVDEQQYAVRRIALSGAIR